jgi:hypothetical protein
VDFWDLTKLLVRRWMFAVPMVVLSAVLTVVTVGHLKPDYVSTAYVSLVPPVLGATKPGQATPDQRNPWLSQGLMTLGNAAIITVLDQTVVKELEDSGYSTSYTVTMGSSSPLVSFEVVGKTKQQATATTERLVERFNQSVAKLQSDFGVSKADSVSAQRLDLGTNVKESNSKIKRALVAVAGAGLLMTAAVTVGADAWLRRRRRRRADSAAAAPPTMPVSGQVRRTQPAPAAVPPSAVVVGALSGGTDETERDAPSAGAAPGARKRPPSQPKDGVLAGVNVEYQPPGERSRSVDADDSDSEAAVVLEVPADATIVLPLSLPKRERWPGKNGDRKSRP